MACLERILIGLTVAWTLACGSKPAPTSSPGETTSSIGSASGSTGSAGPAGVGQVCGARGAAACPADLFCNYEPADACGAADKAGHCAAKPQACPRIAAPVCGCDGKTYGNACEASAAGVGVKQASACS